MRQSGIARGKRSLGQKIWRLASCSEPCSSAAELLELARGPIRKRCLQPEELLGLKAWSWVRFPLLLVTDFVRVSWRSPLSPWTKIILGDISVPTAQPNCILKKTNSARMGVSISGSYATWSPVSFILVAVFRYETRKVEVAFGHTNPLDWTVGLLNGPTIELLDCWTN